MAVLGLTGVTTIGGYAAASSPSEIGRKAAAMVAAPGWSGYTGLAATSVGVTMLLTAGIVMAWTTGREFTDGTIVGLFAIPPRRTTIAAAKLVANLAWVALMAIADAIMLAVGGIGLGLPAPGALSSATTIATTAFLLGASALPVMWVSTRWRGYLAGIAATLALVVITNVAAGFGFGGCLPWAIPVLWATPGTNTPAGLLMAPSAVSFIGAWATRRAWRHLQLGAS